MRNSNNSLKASFWVMIVLQTLTAVDLPGMGKRKMPHPGAYVTIILAWAGLNLAADVGFEEGANVAGWVYVLAALVLGPLGTKLTNFMTKVVQEYAPNVATSSTTTSSNIASTVSSAVSNTLEST